ncbi:MAG: low-specificity L-threonine aldolase [Betaproteobacteria bacterium]|jgi:threonine aldolase|nr:MAG: low-specificity L-threonine aldolase [Betaproteobacteria bacterium]
MNKVIDLRSDTVTRPTPQMRKVMADAEVGDDVYGEDPSVNRLEALAAEMLGKEAAIFVPTGTQSNLLALLCHCERGDEYIVGQQGHTYKYEGGGAAVLGSIQPQPLDYEADGTLDLARVEAAIKPNDPHFACTRLLCLENTQGGKVLPLEYLKQARAFCDRTGLALHLDGARLFNAAVALDVAVSDIGGQFDTVSVCLSKGLGAPVGSVLCGPRELIDKARRWRKVLGGGMRQAGVLAAAGIYALQNHVARLKEDHDKARRLAEGLMEVPQLNVVGNCARTNMVFVEVDPDRSAQLKVYLGERDMLVGDAATMRLVTHLDIDPADIERFVGQVNEFFERAA